MPLFLTPAEQETLHAARHTEPVAGFRGALLARVDRRAASPGLLTPETDNWWWYCVSEYTTDAALAVALQPTPARSAWLRDVVLSLARRPPADWIGPFFRDHETQPPRGNLETAHLGWSLAVALDLAPAILTPAERDEIAGVLRERAIPLCQRWLDAHHHFNNWRAVLLAGVTVPAAVLDDRESLARCQREFARLVDTFQPDGSSGESLQYGSYAAYALMLAREALVRHDPALDAALPLAPYVRYPRWHAASLFYVKPLSGWGTVPRPRCANFNDSGAIHRAPADLLLHLAVRGRERFPAEAGLARWLFDTLYADPAGETGPHDRASFGFANDFGFLTLPLLPRAPAPLDPVAAGLSETAAFDCGDVLARDSWANRTVLAARTAAAPLHGPGHLHGDLHSFILVHNRERLLVDPGHSCYRNILHDWETSTAAHSTCTFQVPAGPDGPARTLQQSHSARRTFDPATGQPHPPVDRGGRRLLVARFGDISVIGSEAAALYGAPLTRFERWWLLAGAHVLFVVDRFAATRPVVPTWRWMLNNRDDRLDLRLYRPDRLVARRGGAAMKLFHLGGGRLGDPRAAHVHDAYHPRPGRLGEGISGTGQLVSWTAPAPSPHGTVVHAFCFDTPGQITGWHLLGEGTDPTLVAAGDRARWQLHLAPDGDTFVLTELVAGTAVTVRREPATDTWSALPTPSPRP
jgi:hypothetical protein